MKVAIVYGTRPEYLKLKALVDCLSSSTIHYTVIKINQHVNIVDDETFYNHLLTIDDLTEDRIANVGANILTKLPSVINDYTHVLAQGDTASVFYSLLCAFQLKKCCIHLEAGMRTYDLDNPFPEEGYRQMISRIANVHLCPSEKEKQYLIDERVNGTIYVVGNTILDLVLSYNIPITYTPNVLITIHRRENWNRFKDYVSELFQLALCNPTINYHFLSHPNPMFKDILSSFEIPKNMFILQSLSHKETVQLLSSCCYVVTDSGGIQEEANFLGKYIYVLRKTTERNAIPLTKMTFCDVENVKDIVYRSASDRGFEYGDGTSSSKIVDIFKHL